MEIRVDLFDLIGFAVGVLIFFILVVCVLISSISRKRQTAGKDLHTNNKDLAEEARLCKKLFKERGMDVDVEHGQSPEGMREIHVHPSSYKPEPKDD